MRHDFYVYVLLDPRKPGSFEYGPLSFDYEPFYVGKGKGKRDRSHFRMGNVRADAQRIRSPFKVNKILKILEAGLEPIVVRVKQEATEKVALRLEIRAIELIGRKPLGPLTNATSGGDGVSGYKGDELHCERKGKAAKAWHATLTPDELVQRSVSLSIGVRKYLLSCTPEQLAERGRRISEGHKKRTPEEQLLLQTHFREVQLNLPAKVQRLKNKRTSRGLKKFNATRATVHYLDAAAKQSEAAHNYWDSITDEERMSRGAAIKAGYAKKSKRALTAKNTKIADAIKAKHASASVFDTRMRSFMVMVGVMMRNANIVDEDLKARLRASATRYYSKEANLDNKPSVLREKVRKLIAA